VKRAFEAALRVSVPHSGRSVACVMAAAHTCSSGCCVWLAVVSRRRWCVHVCSSSVCQAEFTSSSFLSLSLLCVCVCVHTELLSLH
jgi:hypothetical protein